MRNKCEIEKAGKTNEVETLTWEDVFETMESCVIDLELRSADQNMPYHEAALLMNRLETVESILRSLKDPCGVGSSAASDMLLNKRTERDQNLLIVQELCELFNQIHVFWANKVVVMQRNTITLLDFGARNNSNRKRRPYVVCFPKRNHREPTC